MIFTSDTFTDIAGTLLENHTGETGATWTKNPAFTSGSAAITAADRLRGNGTNGLYYESGVPSAADYDVEADLYVASNINLAGLLGRLSTSAATYYLFDYEQSNGQFHLYTVSAGSTLNQTDFTMSLTIGQTYHLRLSLRGSLITCYVNGSPIISITDANITAAGRAGVYFYAADTDTTGYHLDNFTGAIPNTALVTDPNLFFSPYNWFSDGAGALQSNNVNASSTFARSNTPGAYLKCSISAVAEGYATLLLDTSALSGITAANCPMLAISLDGQAFTTPLLAYATGTTRLSLSTNLSAGTHTLLIYFRSVNLSSSSAMGDRWNTPASCVKITGIELDGKGSATTAQTVRPKRLLAFGDSITEAADAVGSANANSDQDATQSYAQLLAIALDAEVGIVAFSGQGWSVGGYGNVPAFYNVATPALSTYFQYASGQSRLASNEFAPIPDFITVLLGRNDAAQSATDAGVTAAVSAWLAAIGADAPGAQIGLIIPPDGSKNAAITAAFAGQANVTLIDPSAAMAATLSTGGLNTNDAMHPNVRGNAVLAGLILAQLAPSAGDSVVLSQGTFEI